MDDHEKDHISYDWPADRIKPFGYKVVDVIANHLSGLPGCPVFQPYPPALIDRYLQPSALMDSGQDESAILESFLEDVEPYPLGNGHPRFFGWVNSPPTPIGVFAEALAAAMNPSCAGGNHAAVYVERQVVNWFKHIVGFPTESMGLLVSGTSVAAVTAMAVARYCRCGFDVRGRGLQGSTVRLLVYMTEDAHGCHQKAVELLGIGSENIRWIRQNSAHQMDPQVLDAALADDIAEGYCPLCVVATAGTVNTGAIDPLDSIADVCSRHDVWLHVDGAYGGLAILTDEYHTQLAALSRADSISLDPHKWLYVPVEAGLVLVKDAAAMRATFSLVPPYLQTDDDLHGVGGPAWFSEFGMQQTRGFKALKVWMAMRHHGISGYRDAIRRDIQLARELASLLQQNKDFEVHEPQSLSIVCFRHVPCVFHLSGPNVDLYNKKLLQRLQISGEVFLSGTTFDGKFWLRACIINPRTTASDIPRIVTSVRIAGESEVGTLA